jgi:hypothetical protein
MVGASWSPGIGALSEPLRKRRRRLAETWVASFPQRLSQDADAARRGVPR